MTNDEQKKKIVEVISQKQTYGIKEEFKTEDLGHGGWQAWTETTKVNNAEIADALIAAGIGDVKEAEQRAEVAEKAGRIIQRDMARVFDISNPRVCKLIANIWDLAKKQAKKELAEEGRNEI